MTKILETCIQTYMHIYTLLKRMIYRLIYNQCALLWVSQLQTILNAPILAPFQRMKLQNCVVKHIKQIIIFHLPDHELIQNLVRNNPFPLPTDSSRQQKFVFFMQKIQAEVFLALPQIYHWYRSTTLTV